MQTLERTGRKSINKTTTSTSRIGDYWEIHVTKEALLRGAEVYRNVSCTGQTDLILKWNNMLLECDVKQMRKQLNIWKSPGRPNRKSTHILVNPETEEIRWKKGKAPLGWEDFWN